MVMYNFILFFVSQRMISLLCQDFSNPFDLFESLFEGMNRGAGSRGSWNGAIDGEDESYSLVLNFK